MCERVIYKFHQQQLTVNFAHPNAKLPVVLKNKAVILLPWGNRKNKNSKFPLGAAVCLRDIIDGKWDELFPKPVKIPVMAFKVQHMKGEKRWFHLPWDKVIQGMVVRYDGEYRVYIVSLPNELDNPYINWPRVKLG